MDSFQISAKDLGDVELPSHCQKCFWYKLGVDRDLPFQKFPGIFGSFDSLNKRMVHDHLDNYGVPDWFGDLPEINGWEKPKRFKVTDPETGVVVSGEPDGIFRLANKEAVMIGDYKTARLSHGQDELMPLYTVQLNVYAWARSVQDMSPALHLFLAYMDPQTHRTDIAPAEYIRRNPAGYQLDFNAQIVNVELKTDGYIPSLLAKVAKIHALKKPPKGRQGCKNCPKLQRLLELADAGLEIADAVLFGDLLYFGVDLCGSNLRDAVRSARSGALRV